VTLRCASDDGVVGRSGITARSPGSSQPEGARSGARSAAVMVDISSRTALAAAIAPTAGSPGSGVKGIAALVLVFAAIAEVIWALMAWKR
jgi:hypothetical protein